MLKVFDTDNKSEAETQLKQDGREYIWHDKNDLEYWFTKPAIVKHHKTGSFSFPRNKRSMLKITDEF